MTTRTVFLDRGLPELSDELEQAWRRWMTQHGLPDPNEMPAGRELNCDDDARTVTFDQWRRNEAGKHYLEPNPYRPGEQQMAYDTITLQLEAPALPLPDGYPVKIAPANL
jgi:hypothetical protein